MKKEIKIIVFLIIIFIIILAVFLYFTRNESTNIDFSKPLTSEEIVQLTKKSSEINNSRITHKGKNYTKIFR